MVICHDGFPTGCFLALAPPAAPDEADLAAHLARACRSSKPAVWVDCRLLDTLSPTAAWWVWTCQQRLHRRHARLVLCWAPAAVKRTRRQALTGAGVPLLSTMDGAASLA